MLQLPKCLAEFLFPREKSNRLIDSQVQHFVDVLSTHRDIEHLGLVALPAAVLARHINVRHEDHFDFEGTGALTRLAPSTAHIEAECPGAVLPLTCQRSVGEDISDLVERFDVRDRIRAR